MQDNLRGWIDPSGKFHEMPEYQTHEDFARKFLHWKKEGYASDKMYFLGWWRVHATHICELLAQSDIPAVLNDMQKRTLKDLAVENGILEIIQENAHGIRVIWQDEGISRTSRIANGIIGFLRKKFSILGD